MQVKSASLIRHCKFHGSIGRAAGDIAGGSIILRPVRPTWGSFSEVEKADLDFMAEREDVVTDEGRFDL